MDTEFIKGRPIVGVPRYCTECLLVHQKEHAVILLSIGTRVFGLCTQHAVELAQLMKTTRKE